MPLKTYILLDTMDADAPIFQQVEGGKRVPLKKIPFHRPTLRQTFYTKDGESRTIRYKSSAVDGEGKSVLDQRKQIDTLKIEANVPWTSQERKDLLFRNGILVTNKKIAQDFLEEHPECEGFEGTCDDVTKSRYKILDATVEAKLKNSDTRKRIKAANKVLDLTLEEKQALLIRLNGSFFETPNPKNYQGTEEEKIEAASQDCENLLMNFIDDAEEGGLDAVLKEETQTTVDEKTTILIGRLVSEGLLSFDAVSGAITKKGNDGKWITVRDMSAEYSLDERKRLFSDFLNTEDGKLLKDDLTKDLEKGKAKKQTTAKAS